MYPGLPPHNLFAEKDGHTNLRSGETMSRGPPQTDRDRDTQTHRQRDRQTERHRKTETERDTETENALMPIVAHMLKLAATVTKDYILTAVLGIIINHQPVDGTAQFSGSAGVDEDLEFCRRRSVLGPFALAVPASHGVCTHTAPTPTTESKHPLATDD